MSSPSAPRSILICNIRLIGDVILTTPLVGLLKESYPEALIDLLVNPGTGEFLKKDPRVNRVIYTRSPQGKGYLREIFRKYDLAVTLNASDRGSVAAVLAGRRTRVGFHPEGGRGWQTFLRRMFFTHSIEFPPRLHIARLGQLIGESLGIEVGKLQAKLYWDAVDQERVDAFLESFGHRPFFVLHPFARWIYKYWSLDKFAALSDSVAKTYGLFPVWTSSPGPGERELLSRTVELCEVQPAAAPGILTLNQVACLLSRASLYLGLDTAVTHIAASSGVPIVALYGPTIAERWSPWNNDGPVKQQCPLPRGGQRTGKTILLQKDRPCVPCGQAGCDDSGENLSPCLMDIGMEEVLDAVDALLAGNPRHQDFIIGSAT